jgi:hypothetical protein
MRSDNTTEYQELALSFDCHFSAGEKTREFCNPGFDGAENSYYILCNESGLWTVPNVSAEN